MNQSETVDIPILTEPQKVLLAELQKNDQNRLAARGLYADYITGGCVKTEIWLRDKKTAGILYKDHICLQKGRSCLNLPPSYDGHMIISEGNAINQMAIDEALQQGPVTVWVLRFATPAGWWIFASWKKGEGQDSFGDPLYFTDKIAHNDDKSYFLNELVDMRYGCWGKLLDEHKDELEDVIYNRYPYSVNDDFSWRCGEADASALSSVAAGTNTEKMLCPVCGWVHDEDLTKWINPKSVNEVHTVIAQTDRHKFLVYLHDGMGKNRGDVSLTEFMKKHRKDGKDTKDVLGPLFKVLFQSTERDRGKIRLPGLKRSPGRPEKKKIATPPKNRLENRFQVAIYVSPNGL